jgi:hypothetical protein
MFVNLFRSEPGTALAETCRAEDESIPLKLGEQDQKVVEALLSLDSFAVNRAPAAVYLAGAKAAARGRTVRT